MSWISPSLRNLLIKRPPSFIECIPIGETLHRVVPGSSWNFWGFLIKLPLLAFRRSLRIRNPQKFQELPGITLCNVFPIAVHSTYSLYREGIIRYAETDPFVYKKQEIHRKEYTFPHILKSGYIEKPPCKIVKL